MSAVEEIIRQAEGFLGPLPSWQDRMAVVASGVLSWNESMFIAAACCEVCAPRQRCGGRQCAGDERPIETVSIDLEGAVRAARGNDGAKLRMARELLQTLGRVADRKQQEAR